MRVISGEARGTKLQCPDSARPTSDKVKEGIFSSVQFLLTGAKCLDICAGSGALGIEALSRQAAKCTFVDSNRVACEVIKQNLQKAKLYERASVLTIKSEDYLKRCVDSFDIIFYDPPYSEEFPTQTLARLGELLTTAGMIIFECSNKEPMEVEGLQLQKSYRYGSTYVYRYVKSTAGVEVETEE